jgi:hypothetical protein
MSQKAEYGVPMESNKNLRKFLSVLGVISTPVIISASVMMLYGMYGGPLAVDVLNYIFEYVRDILFNAIGKIGSTVLSSALGVLGAYALIFKVVPTLIMWKTGRLVRGTEKNFVSPLPNKEEVYKSLWLRYLYSGAGFSGVKLFKCPCCREPNEIPKESTAVI